MSNAELGLSGPEWGGKAPLWFYILAEAELQEQACGSAVGGRIVAETILGVLDADKDSYFHQRGSAPTLPAFGIGDLLRFAGLA